MYLIVLVVTAHSYGVHDVLPSLVLIWGTFRQTVWVVLCSKVVLQFVSRNKVSFLCKDGFTIIFCARQTTIQIYIFLSNWTVISYREKETNGLFNNYNYYDTLYYNLITLLFPNISDNK